MRAMAATLTILVSTTVFQTAKADPADFEFRLVESAIKQGDGAIIAVTLIDKRSGKPVPEAVIFATRIDMAPDGMEMMASKIEALPSSEPGTYRFRSNLTMVGGWRLSLGAKVQGEVGTVESRLVLKAVP
jgi:hypothetical protein